MSGFWSICCLPFRVYGEKLGICDAGPWDLELDTCQQSETLILIARWELPVDTQLLIPSVGLQGVAHQVKGG